MMSTDSAKANRFRSRFALVAAAVAMAISSAYFMYASHGAVHDMEARAIAGDFQGMSLEEGKAEIDMYGLVENHQAPTGLLRSVASTHLVPPGTYMAVIVADDGVEAHRKKAQLVIGARDKAGLWHPASAAAIAERLGRKSH